MAMAMGRWWVVWCHHERMEQLLLLLLLLKRVPCVGFGFHAMK